jgi:hypothetical protein
MFSRKPQIHIDKVDNIEIHPHLHPFLEELVIDLIRKTTHGELPALSRWPTKEKSPLETEPSKANRILDTIGKVVSIVSALAIFVFIILLWLGQSTLASVNITNLLSIVSVTLIGGLVSVGGVRIFSFQASLRRMQQIVQAQVGCPFVPLPLGSHRRNNGDYRPGNPQFCVKCPLGIDISSNHPDGLVHNCRVYPELHKEWVNNH